MEEGEEELFLEMEITVISEIQHKYKSFFRKAHITLLSWLIWYPCLIQQCEGIQKFKNVSTNSKWNTITFELFYSKSFRMVADVRKMYLQGK